MTHRPMTKFGEINLWERAVQFAFSRFVKKGDTIFDIGGNIGALAIAFSKMTGPTGHVSVFECNPNLLVWMEDMLNLNEAANVEIVDKACYRESGVDKVFYCENSLYGAGSSLNRIEGNVTPVKVKTISVDDYINQSGKTPTALKIDIEGAEIDVLKGADKLLNQEKPVIVLEYGPYSKKDEDPLIYLQNLGYQLYDTNTYDLVDPTYYNNDKHASNVLAFVPSKARPPLTKSEKGLFSAGDRIQLPAGHYVLQSEIVGEASGSCWISLETADGIQHAFYEAPLEHLKHHSCSSLVSLSRDDHIFEVKVGSRNSGDNISMRNIKVWEII